MKSKFLLGVAACVLSLQAAANSMDEQVVQKCQALPKILQQGNADYQQKRYQQALEHYQEHASWMSLCAAHEDTTGKTISEKHLATAYNNVGIAYARLGHPMWARAWYGIDAKASVSQFNLKALPPLPAKFSVTGQYVDYVGQGQWNVIEVSDDGGHYNIEFSGLRMGLYGLLSGPNMGEFQTHMSKNTRQARYQYEQCTIDLAFKPNFSGVKVQQNEADCGFGMGVYAQGDYVKVETLPF